MKFAKIIELEETQVLITKEVSDEGEPELLITAVVDAGRAGVAKMTLAFPPNNKGKTERDFLFDEFNEESALEVYEVMLRECIGMQCATMVADSSEARH